MINLTNAEFMRRVFHAVQDDAYLWGAAFSAPPEKASRGDWYGEPLTDVALERGIRYSDRHFNPFYCVSTFKEGSDGRVHRRMANFVSAHVITMDDIGSGASAKVSWDRVSLEPSFVIETSPDNCQVGYILSEPCEDMDLFNRMVDALVEQGLAAEADPGMKGVTRYVRMPFGANTKEKYGKPFHHVVHGWHPERRYSLKEIKDAYGLKLARPKAVRKKTSEAAIAASDDPFVKLFEELGLVQTGELRDGGDFNMLDINCPWMHEHTDRETEGTVYMVGGGFSCFHGHCVDRTFADVREWLSDQGYDVPALERQLRDSKVVAGNREVLERIMKMKRGFKRG